MTIWTKLVELVQKAVSWLTDVLPTTLVGMAWVYNFMKSQTIALKAQVAKLALEVKYKENEKRVEEANRGKSDLDIVRDAISEGGRGTKRKGDSDQGGS